VREKRWLYQRHWWRSEGLHGKVKIGTGLPVARGGASQYPDQALLVVSRYQFEI
jgi:hypothetical protein